MEKRMYWFYNVFIYVSFFFFLCLCTVGKRSTSSFNLKYPEIFLIKQKLDLVDVLDK